VNLIGSLHTKPYRIRKRYVHKPYFHSAVLLLFLSPAGVCYGLDSKADFSAFISYEHIYYFQDLAPETKNYYDELRVIPKEEIDFNENLSAAFSVEFRKDFTDNKNSRVFVRDGYIDISLVNSDLRLGSQFITWGRADYIKPTDVFERHDYTDLLNNRVEQIVAFKWDYYFTDFTLEAVWAPIFQEDIISYELEDRWLLLPRKETIPGLGTLKLDYNHDGSKRPANDASSSQLGIRLDRTYAGWDFGFMYAWTYDRSPTFVEPKVLSVDPANHTALIQVTPRYKRIQVFGGDWATTLSKFGFRGEVAYVLTDDPNSRDPEIDDPYLKLVGGIDYTFTDLIRTWDLLVIGEFALDTEAPHQGAANQDASGVAALRHFYQYALLADAELKFSPFSQLNFKGYINLEKGDHLMMTEFKWKPLDGLAILLGAEILGGAKDTFFGQFRSNDRIRATITYEF